MSRRPPPPPPALGPAEADEMRVLVEWFRSEIGRPPGSPNRLSNAELELLARLVLHRSIATLHKLALAAADRDALLAAVRRGIGTAQFRRLPGFDDLVLRFRVHRGRVVEVDLDDGASSWASIELAQHLLQTEPRWQ